METAVNVKHNFSAGPAILPRSVIETAAQAVLDWDHSGLSILEVSHRGKAFVSVMENARALAKDLFGLGDDYETLFLGGGASTQFLHLAYNLLDEKETGAYINTGTWASNAIKEAKHAGQVDVVASSEDKGFSYIPKSFDLKPEHKYLHITTNNTIYGTQYQSYPSANGKILVADMSSDIYSKEIDASQFDLIYAGAQKNLGPSGTTLIIVKKSILGKLERTLPSMVNYLTHIGKDSMFNTPPVFPIYVVGLTMQWIKEQGGLKAMEKRNREKAETLYAEIDRNTLFTGFAAKEDRSWMNATFQITNKDLESKFVDYCNENDIVGIKGHRSVGGFRASMYNALELSSVQHLVHIMREFEKLNA